MDGYAGFYWQGRDITKCHGLVPFVSTQVGGKAFTEPALLAGLWVLLAMLDVLQQHEVAELQQLAAFALAGSPNTG